MLGRERADPLRCVIVQAIKNAIRAKPKYGVVLFDNGKRRRNPALNKRAVKALEWKISSASIIPHLGMLLAEYQQLFMVVADSQHEIRPSLRRCEIQSIVLRAIPKRRDEPFIGSSTLVLGVYSRSSSLNAIYIELRRGWDEHSRRV